MPSQNPATALVCERGGRFALESVLLPEMGPAQLLVRTRHSGISFGTELALIREKISWGPFPLCTGYMAVGVIEKAGAQVRDFSVGQEIYFRSNAPLRRKDGTAITSASGTHCSHAVVEPGGTHGADLVPDDVVGEVAAQFVLPAVGYHGVDLAAPRLGDHVVIHGAGPIGLGVIAASAARGCVVTAVDIRPEALALAKKVGADHVIDSKRDDAEAGIRRITPAGADYVFECTGLPSCVEPAMRLCRSEGTLVWQGNYGEAALSFLPLAGHRKQLRMIFPCDDGGPACRRAVMRHLAKGQLAWGETISHRVAAAEAPAFFRALDAGKPEVTGAVVSW